MNQAQVNALLKRIDKTNPELYSALSLLSVDLYDLFLQVNPIIPTPSTALVNVAVDAPLHLAITTFPTALQLSWMAVDDAFRYEVRFGSDWDTANVILTTSVNVANLDPIALSLVYGTYTFLVKSVNISGAYSTDVASISFTVPTISPPVISGNPVGSSALLSWTIPASTWQIVNYRVRRNTVSYGYVAGTFTVIQETSSNVYNYSVEAIDIVGNVGTVSNTLSLTILSPSDYLERIRQEWLDNINESYTNTDLLPLYNSGVTILTQDTYIAGPIVIGETWEDHFVNNGWANIQDQIDAGYPVYIQPTETTGTYISDYDFGSLFTNSTIIFTYNTVSVLGDTVVTVDIATSTDNITYTGYTTGSSLFAASVRYARIKVTFTNMDDLDVAIINNLVVTLNVQLSLDSGNGSAVSTDAGGTTVTMNQTFDVVDSVTITPKGTSAYFGVATSFTTTTFKVLIFNTAGARVSSDFSWKVRGVISS